MEKLIINLKEDIPKNQIEKCSHMIYKHKMYLELRLAHLQHITEKYLLGEIMLPKILEVHKLQHLKKG